MSSRYKLTRFENGRLAAKEDPTDWRSHLKKTNGHSKTSRSKSTPVLPPLTAQIDVQNFRQARNAEELTRAKQARFQEAEKLKEDLRKIELEIAKAEKAKRYHQKDDKKKVAEREARRLAREKEYDRLARIEAERLIEQRDAERRKLAETAAAALEGTKKKKGKKNRAATKIQSVIRMYKARKHFLWIKKKRRKERDLQQRLLTMQAETQKDLAALEEKVQSYKQELKARADEKRAQIRDKTEKAEQTKIEAEKLKKENAAFRVKVEKLKQNTRNLRINNLRLEKSNASQEDYRQSLQAHHDRCAKDNARLAEVEQGYRKKVEELQASLDLRTAYALTEFRTKNRYRNAVRRFIKLVDRDKHEDALRLKVIEMYEAVESLEEKAEQTFPFEIPESMKAFVSSTPYTMPGIDVPSQDDNVSDDDSLLQSKPMVGDRDCLNGVKKTENASKKGKAKATARGDDSDSLLSSSDSDAPPRKKSEPCVRIARPKLRTSTNKSTSKTTSPPPTDSERPSTVSDATQNTTPKVAVGKEASKKTAPKKKAGSSSCGSSSSDNDSSDDEDGKKTSQFPVTVTPPRLDRPDAATAEDSESSSEANNDRSPIKHQNSILDAAIKLTGGTPPQPRQSKGQHHGGNERDEDSDGWSSGHSDSDSTY